MKQRTRRVTTKRDLSLRAFVLIALTWCVLLLVDSSLADWSCTCTAASVNGTYCQAWKCDTDDAACFPADAEVRLISGQVVTMDELAVGDQLLGQDGQPDEVVAFLHRDPTLKSAFVRIVTTLGDLRLTPKHLLFEMKRNDVMLAGEVLPGDRLQHRSGGVATVLEVEKYLSQRGGVYAPATVSGQLYVNDLLASCYALYEYQSAAHLAMLPLRLLPALDQQFVGVHPYARLIDYIWSALPSLHL
mmetsp:Transcript_17830/g.45373  ORF Transcript_17830/g.45373 Transcript_17830/m.45373 type:complete len:245 (+) Transcript_17830:68-802(+)